MRLEDAPQHGADNRIRAGDSRGGSSTMLRVSGGWIVERLAQKAVTTIGRMVGPGTILVGGFRRSMKS
jgi:hypothetical protein